MFVCIVFETIFEGKKNDKDKTLLPGSTSGQAGLILRRQSQSESEQFRDLLMVEETPQRENSKAVKGERHPRQEIDRASVSSKIISTAGY